MALHKTTCPLDCPDACGVLVETDDAGQLVRVRGNPEHPYSRGVLCSKTNSYHERVTSSKRLLSPLIREAGGFREASWEVAVGLIAERLDAVRGPDILTMEYAGSMGMVARKFPMRMMHALGATAHDAGVCDSTSSAGYEAVLGNIIGIDMLEAENADGIIIWGSDVKRTIQHLFPMVKARAAAGVPVHVIDVYRTETMAAVERWGGLGLVIRPGSDSVLALALARAAFERGHVDRAFLAAECHGAQEFEAHLAGAPSLQSAAEITGARLEDIEALGALLYNSQALFLRTGSGWTRRTNGAMGMRAVCSLAAVLGKADRVHYESADIFPFDTDLIARPDLRPAPAPPLFKQVQLGRELSAGRFKAVVVWGHNPALTLPDNAATTRGFARDDLFLVVHEQVMTETAKLADVVLPATMFIEHSDIYRSYGHRVAQYGRRAIAPPPGPKSNVAAFAMVARELKLPEVAWNVTEASLCEELMASVTDQISPEQLATLRAGDPTVFEPPQGTRQSSSGGTWGTPSGKVELVSQLAKDEGQSALAEWSCDPGIGEGRAFWLVSAPSKDTHNTTYLESDRHAKRAGRPSCFVNPLDAEEHSLVERGAVTLHNDYGRITLHVALDEGMPRGLVRVDGFPRPEEVPEGVSINVLSAPDVSDLGGGTTYYSTRVDLSPA
ncbi:MAG: anaerobic selenocysteine-containing dehydrogenase [Planctomycetota bacterium]|jgi:anaerobic selenocysteine-containing dehydrogenase